MLIRQIRPSDHEKLNALIGANPSKFQNDKLDFGSKNFVAGMVVADEADEPRMLLAFHRTAEAHVVIDHNFDVPAYRLVALKELIEAAKPIMESLGYEDVFGTVMPDVPHGYLKRLKAIGCGILENCTLVKYWKEQQ